MFDEMQAVIDLPKRDVPDRSREAESQAPTGDAPGPAASSIARALLRCVASGLVGMTLGALALSSAVASGEAINVLSIAPLVMALVALASGWVGAMFWMFQDDRDTP